MNHEATHFDPDCLQRLLEDALPEPLAGQAAEHVAVCAECRGRLEALAGHSQWWSQVCSGVKAILADPGAYSSIGNELPPLSETITSEVSAFATDFAVDFLEPSDNAELLGRLGEYEILEIVGRGGMGIVLKGYQRELNRYVAVKVLAPHLALSVAARKRFAREAQATAAVVHPHVMAIHAVAPSTKLPYFVMPFVPCESLQQRLNRNGPLDLKDILRIGLQAAAGLAAAHAQGLVHRDVKPANILLEISVDRVMLTDFGLARAVDDASLTQTGMIAGTPQFMSPEQAGGDAVDHRSDLFSLGSVLYAMCTGHAPFRAETTFGVLRRIRESPPRAIREINADIPEWLEQIVLKLLSKSPADRIDSATEVASLLEQCLAHVQQPASVALPEAIRARALRPGLEVPKPLPTTKVPRRIVAVTFVTFAAIGVLAIWQSTKPETGVQGENVNSSAEPSTPRSQLEWDATQSQLDSTTLTIEQLETDAREDLEGF